MNTPDRQYTRLIPEPPKIKPLDFSRPLSDVLPDFTEKKAKRAVSMNDGIFYDMAPELYYNTAHIGSSLIKWLAPEYMAADFWVRSWMNPSLPQVDTKALAFGRAMHMLILEPKKFPLYFRVKYGVGSTTESGCIGEGDYKLMMAMRDRLMENPFIAGLLSGGDAEVSLFWKHESGAPMRARFDYLKSFTSVDLKFVEELSEKLIGEIIARYQYDVQAAHYHDGLRHHAQQGGHTQAIGNHVIIFQEKAAGSPHKAVAVVLEDDILAEGKSKYDAACYRFQDFVAKHGHDKPWPGFKQEVLSLDATMMPRWWSGQGMVI